MFVEFLLFLRGSLRTKVAQYEYVLYIYMYVQYIGNENTTCVIVVSNKIAVCAKMLVDMCAQGFFSWYRTCQYRSLC